MHRTNDREALQTIVDESRRLTRLVENLLDMARLDSGSIVLNRQWHVLEEIVGVALNAVKRELKDHEVRVTIPADFPLLNIDGFLMEQVLVNLLENASRYTPVGSEIEITAVAKTIAGGDSRRRQWPWLAAGQRRQRSSTNSFAARRLHPMAGAAWAWDWRFARQSSKPWWKNNGGESAARRGRICGSACRALKLRREIDLEAAAVLRRLRNQ